MSTECIVIGAIIITLLVLIISAINTVLIATALYNSQSRPNYRVRSEITKLEGSKRNAIRF